MPETLINSNLTKHGKNITVLTLLVAIVTVSFSGWLAYLMLFCSEHYSVMTEDLHQRERTIKAARGRIIDANDAAIVDNRTVCTISVIYGQVTDRERVIQVLCSELGLNEEPVRRRVEKRSPREIMRTNVDRELGDKIRSRRLDGAKADENHKCYYPYDSLTSRVLGFTRNDNQGITGLKVKYEKYLKGMSGKILTMSGAKGVEIKNAAEDWIEPIPGNDLHISLNVNIQKYAEQPVYQVLEKKNAKKISIIVMNSQNGELLTMINVPEFNLNDPFTLDRNLCSQSLQEIVAQSASLPASRKQEQLNQMRKNTCINDTYEPGSTFKIIVAATGLESGAVRLADQFSYPGPKIVEDRKIRCHKVGGHDSETFLQGAMNSCNPAFIDMGRRLGVNGCYKCPTQSGLKGKTEIGLPGEAATIMHKKESTGLVELTTMSSGRLFQVTPIQLITTAIPVANGGNHVTPHLGVTAVSTDQTSVHVFKYPSRERILSEETGVTMRCVLKQVVSEGSGKEIKLEGYKIGGKTATSRKPLRSLKKYTPSFIGFASADDPQVMAPITIDEPEGIYYGGTTAASMTGDLFKNILPYPGIRATEKETATRASNL